MMNVVIKLTCDKIQVFIFSIMLMLPDKGKSADRATVHLAALAGPPSSCGHFSLSPTPVDARASEVEVSGACQS